MPLLKIPPLGECEVTQQWMAPPRRSSSPGPSPCGSTDPDEVEALHMKGRARGSQTTAQAGPVSLVVHKMNPTIYTHEIRDRVHVRRNYMYYPVWCFTC
ncbi:hypothetical protein FKM82_011263 [Ascaphus truei]